MNKEQIDQLYQCLDALQRDFYHPLGPIEYQGFKADEAYSLEQACNHPRQDMPKGTVWGGAGQYCWLFSSIVLPDEAKEQRIVMSLDTGGESTLFINGKPFGTKRAEWVKMAHHHLVDQTIAASATPGSCYELAVETYGGTVLPSSPRGRCATGPVFPEKGVELNGPKPATIGENSFGIFNEEAYQLWLDLDMLIGIWETQTSDSYLKERIGFCLAALLDELDMEQSLDKRRASYIKAHESLAPVLHAHNGTWAPSMSVIGNSHIDVVWLWPMEETIRKTIRTFSQQLRHLEEYPEALFIQSQPVLYEMCRQQSPWLFDCIKKAIRKGNWIADGGMWVEPDTNIPSGESLVRQFLYGIQYFKDELGVKCHIAWLPDTFGYSAALPQVVKLCELEGLTTQKIFWSYNDREEFPFHRFLWKGLDGSEIKCFLHMQYESAVDSRTLVKRWSDRVDNDGSGEFLLPFGYGDGGGGPTRDDFEQIRRERDIQGLPKLQYENPSSFFERMSLKSLPSYMGELYFACHRGTYTVQSKLKKGNRQAEDALTALELWYSLKAKKRKLEYPKAKIEALWKKVLLNQFHDIVSGSAIGPENEKALERYDSVIQDSQRLLASLMDREGAGHTICNSLSWNRKEVVFLDHSYAEGAITDKGEKLEASPFKDRSVVLVNVPSLGHVSIKPCKVGRKSDCYAKAVHYGDSIVLDNGKVRAVFDLNGCLLSFTNSNEIEFVKQRSNLFHFYRDVPRAYDAWDIDSQVFNREENLDASCKGDIENPSGLVASIIFQHKFRTSSIWQRVSLSVDSSTLTFETKVDWHERHKLLKVSFYSPIIASEGANQIQFGHIMRPAQSSRQYDKDRFEVCNHGFTSLFDSTHGVALLNDCKYGVSMKDGAISLSLLRGATNPEPDTDQGIHEFKYSFHCFEGPFCQSRVVQEAACLNSPLRVYQGMMSTESFIALDNPYVIVSAVKESEDGKGDLVLRMYECMGGERKVNVKLSLSFSRAWECNLLEEAKKELETCGQSLSLAFKAFEIKTIRIEQVM